MYIRWMTRSQGLDILSFKSGVCDANGAIAFKLSNTYIRKYARPFPKKMRGKGSCEQRINSFLVEVCMYKLNVLRNKNSTVFCAQKSNVHTERIKLAFSWDQSLSV